MNDTRITRTGRIDSGEPLLLRDPPDADGAAGYAVIPEICANPHCPCTTMGVAIRPARQLGDGSFEVHGRALVAEVSSDGTGLTINDAGTFTTQTVAWIRERLEREDHRLWLRERWSRVRGQAGDPAYPSGVPPEGVDGMVSFREVFPYDFDLTVVHNGLVHLADDQYCLEPACTCDELAVQFVDLSTQRARARVPIGYAKASVRRLHAPSVHGPARVQSLWHQLLDEHGAARLRDRFERMRRIARERPRAASQAPRQNAVGTTNVGRNAPCPCGSGRKFKRCCGA